jgi:hypothetical protein
MNEYLDPGTMEQLPPIVNDALSPYLWPEISPTVVWVAFFIGLLLYIIGYFAGGKLSIGKIFLCIILASVIGFLARGVLNYLLAFLIYSMGMVPHTAYILSSTLWMIFVAGVAVMIYETFTVTAEEAHPDGK